MRIIQQQCNFRNFMRPRVPVVGRGEVWSGGVRWGAVTELGSGPRDVQSARTFERLLRPGSKAVRPPRGPSRTTMKGQAPWLAIVEATD